MGLDGMEVIAIAVVVGLFIVVLKQFGIWEPLSLEGKSRVNFEYFLTVLQCNDTTLLHL